MPAKSQAQQKFMGMVHAFKQGDTAHASDAVRQAAGSMSDKSAKDFASTERKGLPPKVRKEASLGQAISQYNSYGAKLKSEVSMRELAEQLMQIAEFAEQAVMSEADDWFDGHTIKRNMKEMKNYVKEFHKIATEYDTMRQRATALYDDMGRVLERYFELQDDDADDIGYDTDGDGMKDLTAGNAGKNPTDPKNGGGDRLYGMDEEDHSDMVDPREKNKNLTERLLRLARHRLTGEQLVRFDTLKKETQIKAAWRIVR